MSSVQVNSKTDSLSLCLESWDVLDAGEKNRVQQILQKKLQSGEYPIFESDSKVILLFSGDARQVHLNSDITGWINPLPFNKLQDTNMFYLILEAEPDARVEYHILADGIAQCDPSNKFKSLNGLGELSELAMPRYQPHPYFDEYLYGRAGGFEGLIRCILPAGALPYDHEVFVWLPPDYNKSKKYQVVYFHDGPDYIRFALAPNTLNRLVKEGKIDPVLAVFVTPPNLHQPAVPNRSTEYGMNDDYVSFFCDELVPFIDKHYSTLPEPRQRLIAGDSYAGLISFYISFRRPEVFANAYSQSGYFSFNNDKMIKLIEESNRKALNFYLDIGTYETVVGADFLPADELDFTSANRRMKNALSGREYDFRYKEYPEGHTWGNWRRHLVDALIYFFSTKEQQS